mgnify:CR=1 FL=1
MDNVKEKIEAILFATGRVITKEEMVEILTHSQQN